MSKAIDQEVSRLLEAAERQERCLASTGPLGRNIRRALNRRVAAGEVVSPARNLFASAEVWERLTPTQKVLRIARGLTFVHPNWVFCGYTAAVILGLDVSDALLEKIHVADLRSSRGTNTELVQHHPILHEDRPDEVGSVGYQRVTSPSRTLFDCLRWADFAHGLAIVDSALRAQLVTAEELRNYFIGLRDGSRGKESALRTLAWADARSENGGESIARARMIELGYVAPELQVEIPDPLGVGAPYRADFVWVRADGVVILGELDGRRKYRDKDMTGGRDAVDVLADERLRESRIGLYDVAVVRFSFRDTEDPASFSALLDAYGVPRAGSATALPEGMPMVPDWERLRRR